MQCPQCGTMNAPGQDVCARCGSPLFPARQDYGGAYSGGQNQGWPGYAAGENEPVDGVWREEWPALGGAPAQAPLPPWLASGGNGNGNPPSSQMPSGPFAPAPQSNGWNAPPASGPLGSEYPSQYPQQTPQQYTPQPPSHYPSYYGVDSAQINQGGAPQQQMPPMFMVNPPDAYPPDTALAPYGIPPNNALSVPASPPLALTLTPALSPGTALKNGRYRIIQRFSGGSAGSDTELPLMVATDTELPNERVLVQELPLTAAHPEDAEYIRHGIVERLDSLSQVPGIAHLRDSFVEQRRSFLVFELPSGDRLLDRLRRAHGPLPETTVIGIVLQLLDILSALERSPVPIIHGNITPGNIVLRPGGQVALVGFSPTLLIYPTGQVANGPAGTLSAYSAPEQARGTADIRSDLYATCAVMHYAVTGAEPVGRMFPLARHANPAVSLELEDILGQGLRPSPSQRYQSPEALREVLAPLASGKRLTYVDEELDPDSPTGLRLVRDAQGRLVGPRQRMTQNPLFFVAIVLVLVALLGGGAFYALQPHTSAPTTSPQGLTSAFASYYQSKGIGLSGGEFVFDTQQPDYALKQTGALAMGSGDLKGALAAYQKAVTSQPNDVEALIYAADLQILADKEPYVTVIAGVAFGSDDDGDSGDSEDFDTARYELQGIYLAQQRFNQSTTTPGHVRLRVLILNSGKEPADAQLASTLMLDQIHKGNVQNIVGVIGWPESNQSRLAMAALGASGLPLISPTASANNLDDTAGNFYSLVPSDSQQAGDLADAAVKNLEAHRILVAYDSGDQENSDVATYFSNQVIQNYGATTTILGRVTYDAESVQDGGAFQQVAAAAVTQNADLIYLVGNQNASIFLANAVAQQAIQTNHFAPHILVGAQTLMSSYYGVGNDPGAAAARANPDPLGLIYVATLASVNHWQILNMAPPDVQVFSDGFATLFKSFWGAGGLSLPGSLAILSYDATNLLLVALEKNLEMAHNDVVIPTVQEITVAIRQFTNQQPFMGLGGAVGFSNSIHQPNKALGIYKLLPIPNAPTNAPVVQLQLASVVGGKALFCGHSANCIPY
jgi:ABC-type branched-subunit amino acid transport system substrate-binding protein/serine/threonine protein kinase